MDTQAATEDRERVSAHLGPDRLSKGRHLVREQRIILFLSVSSVKAL